MTLRLSIFLIINIVFVLPAMSQRDNSEFLFKDFQNASIYYSTGSYSNEKINYNVKDNDLYYVDKNDGLEKIVINVESILIIKIDNRNFILVKGHLQEVLQTTPPIYIEYSAKMHTKAQNSGYGTTSQTAAITPYAVGPQGIWVPEGKRLEIKGFENNYWIERKGVKKKFVNFNQLLKLYPDNKNVLKEYIKKNQTDFNNVEDIVNFCLYAESLNGTINK